MLVGKNWGDRFAESLARWDSRLAIIKRLEDIGIVTYVLIDGITEVKIRTLQQNPVCRRNSMIYLSCTRLVVMLMRITGYNPPDESLKITTKPRFARSRDNR